MKTPHWFGTLTLALVVLVESITLYFHEQRIQQLEENQAVAAKLEKALVEEMLKR